MRLRHCLIASALLLCWRAPVAAQEINFEADLESNRRTPGPFFALSETPDAVIPHLPALPVARPTPLALKGKDATYRAAYQDTFAVLSAANPCSDFFGGAFALEVFNDLAAQLKKHVVENQNIGALMKGETKIVVKVSTGQSYRLFERAALNSNGAFFRDSSLFSRAPVARVGSFAPNTRQARVLLLLHELAHLIRQPDGRWLIPNDGLDTTQSERNMAIVESVCGAEIRALGD
jgi:hypothetical protein